MSGYKLELIEKKMQEEHNEDFINGMKAVIDILSPHKETSLWRVTFVDGDMADINASDIFDLLFHLSEMEVYYEEIVTFDCIG